MRPTNPKLSSTLRRARAATAARSSPSQAASMPQYLLDARSARGRPVAADAGARQATDASSQYSPRARSAKASKVSLKVWVPRVATSAGSPAGRRRRRPPRKTWLYRRNETQRETCVPRTASLPASRPQTPARGGLAEDPDEKGCVRRGAEVDEAPVRLPEPGRGPVVRVPDEARGRRRVHPKIVVRGQVELVFRLLVERVSHVVPVRVDEIIHRPPRDLRFARPRDARHIARAARPRRDAREDGGDGGHPPPHQSHVQLRCDAARTAFYTIQL